MERRVWGYSWKVIFFFFLWTHTWLIVLGYSHDPCWINHLFASGKVKKDPWHSLHSRNKLGSRWSLTFFFFFFSFPKCHYGQSTYYSNILLCIFCILNASPDVISWSQLLCTEEELAPACVVRTAVQGREIINPQPVLAILRDHLLFPATKLSCWEANNKPSAPNGSGAESVCSFVCTMGNGLLPGRDVEEQEEDAAAAASIMFVTTPLFQIAAP